MHARALAPTRGAAEAVLGAAILRLDAAHGAETAEAFLARADAAVREAAVEFRATDQRLRLGGNLFAQICATVHESLAVADARPGVLADAVKSLDPPDRTLVHGAYELGEPAAETARRMGLVGTQVERDLNRVHLKLVEYVAAAIPDGGPTSGPSAPEAIGRLVARLATGTLLADDVLVLESLLLGDAAGLAFYHRYMAVIGELTWKFGGVPPLPDPPSPALRAARISYREWAITVVFVSACVAVAAFVGYVVWGYVK